MTSDLSGLIDRVERAEAGSRELDRTVVEQLGFEWWPGSYRCEDGSWRSSIVTTSLDAALALSASVKVSGTDALYDALDWLTSNWSARGKVPDGPIAPHIAKATVLATLRAVAQRETVGVGA